MKAYVVGTHQKCLALLMSTHNIWWEMQERALMQFADNAGPDQPAHVHRLIWALIVWVDTVVNVDEQKIPRLDCTDAHGDLHLHCLQNA